MKGPVVCRRLLSLASVAVPVALVASLLVGCAGNSQATPTSQSTGQSAATTGETYKIGGVFAVSGNNSPLGTPERDTAKLLEEQINAKGGVNGHKIEVVAYDTESDETKAVTLTKKLIEQDKVLAVIGPSSTGESMALIDTIEKAQTPLISCAASAQIVQPIKKWVFKTAQSDSLAVAAIFDYLKSKGISKVALLVSSAGYGTTGRAALEAAAPSAGISIVSTETFGDKDVDMTSQLTRIKGTDAQAVICWGTNPAPATVTKNMRQLSMTIPLLQSHGVANEQFLKLAGDSANGVVLPAGKIVAYETLPDSDPQKAVLSSYVKSFQDKYGRAADGFGGYSYDALMLVTKALEKSGTDKEKLRDEIEKVTGYVGISGVFNMSATDHNGLDKSAFTMVKIVNGKWTLEK